MSDPPSERANDTSDLTLERRRDQLDRDGDAPDLALERRRYELIDRVVDLPEEARDAALAEVDPALAADVRAMLQAAEAEGEGFLAPALAVAEPEDELPPAIGPYRPIALLGEGGMGRVFLAEQSEPVERRVALKILRFAAAGREARARFAAERHAMGRLDHPNVGRILEAGTTPDGLPFFAMELIDGAPITAYCDQRSLSLEERLRLFIDVCRGADHAHHKLLLHRDVKPSNVLVTEVDGRPVPKLIDFGIAKGLDRSLADATLATGDRLIGTPGYMSPEALGLGGDIDTRSDVFSLGVVLYELLTSQRPWPAPDPDDSPLAIMKRQADSRRVRPSTRVTQLDEESMGQAAGRRGMEPAELPRRLRGDLDWIALKAIARDPGERYASAADLADDVERFLAEEPVIARAPTAGYLLRKLVRRRRGTVAAAVAVLAALVLGAAGTTVGLLRARAEAEAAGQARDRAVRAQQSSDQLASYLKDLFGEADSSLENPAELSAREILERGAEALAARLQDQPRQRAVLLHTVGEIYTRWDELDRAESLLAESLELLESVDAGPDGATAGDRIDVLEKLADLRIKEGRFEEALGQAEDALALQSGEGEAALQTARLETRAAAALTLLNRYEEAEARLERGLELLAQLPDGTPGRLDALGRAYMELGGVSHRRRDALGLDYYRQALAAYEQAHGADSRFVVPALNRLAYWMVDAGRLKEAEATIRRCLDLQERLLGPETLPVSRSQHLLGRVLNKQGRYPEAERAFRHSLEIRDRLSSEPHPLHANTLALLAYMIYLQRDGRDGEVEALFAQAEEAMRDREPAYPVFSAVMSLRARVEMAEDRPARAEAYLRRGVEWLEGLEKPPLRHISTVTMRIAEALVAQGRDEAAREVCRKSMSLAEQSAKPDYVTRRRQELERLGCL